MWSDPATYEYHVLIPLHKSASNLAAPHLSLNQSELVVQLVQPIGQSSHVHLVNLCQNNQKNQKHTQSHNPIDSQSFDN